SVLAYELGFKERLLENRLLVTGAAFYYDYRNKQLRGFFNQPPFGIVFALDNVPKSAVKGGELALAMRPLEGLSVTASATYMNATIKKYSGLDSTGNPTDFAGDRVPFAPQFSFNAGADYSIPVTGSELFGFGFSVNHNSATQAS